jgi:hypothetical protein
MNYFVSGKSLRIQERNLYTATELVTLIPVQENRYFANFIRANLWAYVYFPNLPVKIGVEYGERPKSFVKYWIEKGFANAAGNILDDYCWRITQKRWLRKEQQKEVNSKGFPMSLIAEKQLAKPSPAYFQQKVLNAYLNRVGYLDTRFYQVSAC